MLALAGWRGVLDCDGGDATDEGGEATDAAPEPVENRLFRLAVCGGATGWGAANWVADVVEDCSGGGERAAKLEIAG
jgi:hypothetical protein